MRIPPVRPIGAKPDRGINNHIERFGHDAHRIANDGGMRIGIHLPRQIPIPGRVAHFGLDPRDVPGRMKQSRRAMEVHRGRLLAIERRATVEVLMGNGRI